MLTQKVKQYKVKFFKGKIYMKTKIFAFLIGSFLISSCANDEQYVGSDSLIMDNTFREIPTHDHIDCFGSCTVKIYNVKP